MKTTLLLVAVMLISFVSLSAIPQSKPQQWEYRFEYRCSEKTSNQLGNQGWELAGFTSSYLSAGAGSLDTCVFKRIK